MPLALSYPGVYIEEVSSGVRTIAGVATSIGLFIGWAARGPTEQATRIFSFSDYERTYGGLDRRTPLGYAVKQFFENGGSDAYVIRVLTIAEGATGATPAVVSDGDLEFTAISPGEWAHGYSVRIKPRPAPDDNRFKLEVLVGDKDSNVVAEVFENLSMLETDPRFVEAAVNGNSRILTVEASGATDPAAVALEFANGSQAGTDGDVIEPGAAEMVAALEDLFADDGIATKLDLFNLVCVPNETLGTTVQKLQGWCAAKRAFLIVDPPEDDDASEIGGHVVNYISGSASYSALYFPRVRAPDPLQRGAIRAFPPCGFVAGIMARTDAQRGVWKAPAGTDAALNGVVGFTETLSDAQNGVLNLQAVNCLRTLPVYGNVVWGARTLEGDNNRGSEWKYVPVRRMALFLEESLFRGTQWVVFEPNDEPLWAQIRLNIGAFMQTLFRQGAFQGTTPREAYFVKCDRTTTTQADINLGIVNIHVGFAPLKPAEFVVLRIQQIAGDIPT
jgi:phage tail sheath protein FI